MNRRPYLAAAATTTATGLAAGCLAGAPGGDRSCPPYPGERDGRTVCDGGGSAPVSLRAGQEGVPASGGAIAFTFANDADQDVAYGPCLWTVYERSGGGWRQRRPLAGDAVGRILPAGGAHELVLRVRERDPPDRRCAPCAVAGLDPGPHLFGVHGTAPDGTGTLFLASFRVTA